LPNFKVIAFVMMTAFIFAVSAAEPDPGEQELQRYTGDFWEPEDAFAGEVRVVDGKLWAVHSPTRRNELVPAGPDRFEMIGLPAEVYVEYTMDSSGIVEMRRTIDGQERGRFTPFTPRQATAEELMEYTGEYMERGSDSGLLLGLEEGRLAFRSGTEPAQQLTPLFEDTFENADVGSFIFERNADGVLTGFSLHRRGSPVQIFDKRQQNEAGKAASGSE